MALDVLDGNGDAKTVKTTLSGSDHVAHHHVDSSALPTGASTSAKQDTIITALANLGALIATGADALANTTDHMAAGALSYLFNGTSWDRMRGDTTNGLDVDVTRSALPSGASTSANQSTIITALADIATEATLATIDTVLDAINAKLAALGQAAMAASMPVAIASDQTVIPVSDNAGSLTVDGSVSLAAAIPAGTNNIGDVDILSIAAGTNNIGDVDIASIAAGDNNIGNVDIASIAAGDNNIGNVDLASAIPAGTNNIGDVDVASVTPPSTVYAGQTTVTTAGTEVTLGASQALTQGVWIKAKAANTGDIFVGLNGVTSSTGYVLDAGESVFVPIDNRTTVFIDSSVNGEGVSYIAF